MTILSHKDLEVWQKAMDLVESVYSLTKDFPKEEIYGLTSQMRRSAVSIPSNIAEGHSKKSTREFIRYVNIASGSAAELETQLLISKRLGYVRDDSFKRVLESLNAVGKMLNKLSLRLEKKAFSPSPESPVPSPDFCSPDPLEE